ncbi:MAG: hypothetical protein CBARDCOR_6831 [uncultured Caballeronia sp.]|nr:MAG: hypothetical protein CBARDCOR_6831 [uncultured Caballeronia sp.]
MATTHDTEARQVIHHATAQLSALNFMDQDTAKELSRLAEAVANLFMVVFYQAETSRAIPSNFNEAMAVIRRTLRRTDCGFASCGRSVDCGILSGSGSSSSERRPHLVTRRRAEIYFRLQIFPRDAGQQAKKSVRFCVGAGYRSVDFLNGQPGTVRFAFQNSA